jgi:hypothetical protein
LIALIVLILKFLCCQQIEKYALLIIITRSLFNKQTLTKRFLLLLLHPVGRPVNNAVALQNLLCNPLEIITRSRRTCPLTKAVFLDIDADALLRSKFLARNLLGAVVIVAIAVVIAASLAIRILSTLFS